MVREWCVLYILTWKCASRHSGVHFFISHLASWVRTRRFSEPTFRPSGATNHWKNTVNRDFPTFSRICIFFLLIFSLLTLLTSAFQLSILSEVSLLNFLRLLLLIIIINIYLLLLQYITAMKPPKWLHLVHIGVGTAIRGGCNGFDAQGLGQGIAHLRRSQRSQRHWGLGAITIHHHPSPIIVGIC